MRNSIKTMLIGATALTLFDVAAPQLALAQTTSPEPASAAAGIEPQADAAGAPEAGGEILVTARRRDESIVDVPLAISVVTEEKLRKLDITDTTKLASYVPGLQFSDYTPGYSRNDRGGTRPLIFRGLNLGAGGSVVAAGGLFLDGAAVVGNEIPGGMDIGAVEVLRGPQSVYFGRSTMTGAVSYRTKAIGDEWSGEFEGRLATQFLRGVQGSIAGPLIPNLLKVRVTGLIEDTDGYVHNDASTDKDEKLGDRSRHSISLTAVLTPADTLTFKGYVNYFDDEDGASATAFLPANFANCILPGATRRTFCGKIPGRANSTNFIRTEIPQAFKDRIFISPLIKGEGFKDQVGLQRHSFNTHLVGDWTISDYLKLSSITGYHTNNTLQAADGIGAPVQQNTSFPYSNYFYTITNRSRDFSEEVRLSSDPERAFSWTAGANYINAQARIQAITAFQARTTGIISGAPQSLGTDSTKTYGFFGGGYLKMLDNALTLSAEGRYQIDKRRNQQFNTVTQVQTVDLGDTFRSFNPRVALDYDVGGHRKVYISYASGTRPGGFNALLLSYTDPLVIAEIAQQLGVSNTSYKEEKLKIGEIGFKGGFDNGKGFFDINAYYGKLSNQQITFGAIIHPRPVTDPNATQTITAINNIGRSKAYGIEWQGNYNFTRQVSLATTFAWNHTRRAAYASTATAAQFGTNSLAGTEFTNVPEYTGSAVLAYDGDLTDTIKLFGNVAYVYRGKQYLDAANVAYIQARSQVDTRVGLGYEKYSVELFVNNLLDDRHYTAGSLGGDFGRDAANTYYAFFGAVAPPRQFGIRARAAF